MSRCNLRVAKGGSDESPLLDRAVFTEGTSVLLDSVDLRELLTAALEKGLIEPALEQANGVQAEALGVSHSDI